MVWEWMPGLLAGFFIQNKFKMSKNKYTIHNMEFTCPECGVVNKFRQYDVPEQGREFRYCDPEDGGCDKLLVVKTKTKIEHTVTAHKIEGFNEKVL